MNTTGRQRFKDPLDEMWVTWLYTVFENGGERGERLSDPEIAARAKAEAERQDRDDPPKARTVNLYRHKFEALDEHVRVGYRYFRWPETMGTPGLPWESSRTLLDMMSVALFDHTRPTVAFARWYVRLAQAAPGLRDRWSVYGLTGELLAADLGGADRRIWRAIEAWLALEGWTDPGKEMVEGLVKNGRVDRWEGYNPPDDATDEEIAETLCRLRPSLTKERALETVKQGGWFSYGPYGHTWNRVQSVPWPRLKEENTDG